MDWSLNGHPSRKTIAMKHAIEDRFPSIKVFVGAGYNPFRPELLGWMKQLGLSYQETVILLTLDFFRKPDESVVYPGIRTLSDILNLHPMSFQRPLTNLVKKGMIKITRGKPGRGTPNKYDLSPWLEAITKIANEPKTEKPEVDEPLSLSDKLESCRRNLEEAINFGDHIWADDLREQIAQMEGTLAQ